MSAYSRLTRREIHGVLRALRKLDRKNRLGGEVVATAGEILVEDEDKAFERDSATDDNRRAHRSGVVGGGGAAEPRGRTGYKCFRRSLQVNSMEEARAKLENRWHQRCLPPPAS